MTTLLQDLLSEELTESNLKMIVNKVVESEISGRDGFQKGRGERSKTPGNAKSLLEFYDLVRQAINEYETRASVPTAHKLNFTEEEPDAESKSESLTVSLIRREPGAFGQGAPFESKVKNLLPIFREEIDDPEYPGYKLIITGYWHDNIVRFTCWAKTNKAANARADWFERFMQEYTWWFRLQGVARILFWGRNADIVTVIDGNKWYGRPFDFFVRTESLKIFSEKTIEELIINVAVSRE